MNRHKIEKADNRKIVFLADSHYGANPGATLCGELKRMGKYDYSLYESDWSILTNPSFDLETDLLIINLIEGAPETPKSNELERVGFNSYIKKGKPLFFIHGGISGFNKWAEYREMTGFRWVRKNDPENAPPSTHPKNPYYIEVSGKPHSLSKKIKSFWVPEDEIYINLAESCKTKVLMQTSIEEGTFPILWAHKNRYKGKIVGLGSGHSAYVNTFPPFVKLADICIDWLLEKS